MIAELEVAIVKLEDRAISALTRLENFLWPFVFSLALPILVYFTWPFWSQFEYLKIAHWNVVKNVEILFNVLVLLSPLATVIKRKNKIEFIFAIIFATWWAHCYSKRQIFTESPLTWIAAFALPAILVATWFISTRSHWSGRKRTVSLLAVALGCALFVGYAADQTQNRALVDLLWDAHLEIFLLVAGVRFWTKRDFNQTDLNLTINPMNLIIGVFWPLDLKDEEKSVYVTNRRLWWRGYYYMMTGTLLQLASMVMFANRQVIYAFSGFVGTQWITVCIFLALTAVARWTAGVARLFGADVPDCSNFIFFARSPVDTLRRGYVYAYDFNLRYVFLPLYRRFHSTGVSLVLTLLFYMLLRFVTRPFLVPHFYNWVFSDLRLYIPSEETARDIVMTLVLLTAFLLEPLFAKIKLLGGKRYGDLLCVIATYLLISGMRFAEPDLFGVLRTLRGAL